MYVARADFYGAEITRPLADVGALDGTSAVFECGVRLGQGSVAWYHQDTLLPHSDEFQQLFDGTTARLVITEVFPDDAGTYRCVVRSRDSEADTTAKLTIKRKMSTLLMYMYLKYTTAKLPITRKKRN